jgi:hypothetical protein
MRALVCVRTAGTTALTAAILLGGPSSGARLTVPVAGQQPERLPGPIIEDPPGDFTGASFVPPATRVVVPGAAPLSTFVVTYNGFISQAQTAFQAAVDIWASQIQSSVPIRVTANWTTLSPDVLGSAGPTYVFRNFSGAPSANTFYAAALAKKLSGTDLTAGLPDSADIVANFNSSFSWYFGTDGNAGSQFDLMSVVLHELGHSLGFFGSMTVSRESDRGELPEVLSCTISQRLTGRHRRWSIPHSFPIHRPPWGAARRQQHLLQRDERESLQQRHHAAPLCAGYVDARVELLPSRRGYVPAGEREFADDAGTRARRGNP